jgi:hypothetical protein
MSRLPASLFTWRFLMRFLRFSFILLIMALLLAACAAPAAKATPTLVLQNSSTSTKAPSRTPLPSQTPRPSSTPTLTQSPEPSATPTITPDPALNEITLVGLSWLANYDMLLSFRFPGPVDPTAYLVTLEDREFRCETIAKHPDQLYCHGQGAKVLAMAWVRVYAAGSPQPGYEKEVWIPYFNNNYDTFNP